PERTLKGAAQRDAINVGQASRLPRWPGACDLTTRGSRDACPTISCPVIQPDIDTRRVPVVRLVQDVEITIAIEISQTCFVKAVSRHQLALAEIASAVTIKNPRLRIRIVQVGALLGPLRHLSGEDVQMTITVDVAPLEGVTVNHVAARELVANPVGGIRRIASAFIPFERPDPIARRDDDLRVFARLELSGFDSTADRADLDGRKFVSPAMLEPIIAGQ